MAAMRIVPVSYAEILGAPNAAELIEEYSAECSIPEIGKINPQAEMYAAMEGTGNFKCFGAYRDERLIGFGTVLPYVVPHYGVRIATVESVFVCARQRLWRTGNALLDALEGYAEQRVCEVILYNARKGSQFEKLLRHLRPYVETSSVFLRSLPRRQT